VHNQRSRIIAILFVSPKEGSMIIRIKILKGIKR